MGVPIYVRVGAATAVADTATSWDVAHNATVNAYEIAILHATRRSTTGTIDTPSGWSLIMGPNSSGTHRSYVFGRICDGTELAVLGSVAFRWSSTLLLIFVVGLIFYFVPNTKVRFRDVWPGAILTGLLWRGALLGFSWYVHDLSRFSVHGSIATVVVFLLWVSVSAVILLYGVEFTAAFAELLGDRAAARREQDAAAPA